MATARKKARAKKAAGPADREAREKAIVAELKSGELSYRQIAAKYGVSLPTVNNKARKYGISRGRRKGAKIFVKAIRRSKKAAALPRRATNLAAPARKPGRPRKKAGRPRAAASSAGPARGSFTAALRELVLQHYPNITLRQFDRLSRAVEGELR